MRLTAADISSLLRVGFAARLRAETRDSWIASADSGAATRVDTRDDAAVLRFVGDGGRVAVMAGQGEGFLALADAVSFGAAPGVVKVVVCRERLVALGGVGGAGDARFMSMKGVPCGGALKMGRACGKMEMWHLEVVPGSVGTGRLGDVSRSLSVRQAVCDAILELGVRVRLRSVHGRVLRREDVLPKGVEAGKRSFRVVLQDSPKSTLAESHDLECIFDVFRRGGETPRYVFREVSSGLYLSVRGANMERSKKRTLCETAALLVKVSDADLASGAKGGLLKVEADASSWGLVYIGEPPPSDPKVDPPTPGATEWLMAGARGRLEVRKHKREWESFRIEVVQQTYDAALRELPANAVFSTADAATRAVLRAEVAAKVAAARTGGQHVGGEKKTSKQKKTSGFNHAAALGGLDDDSAKAIAATSPETSKDGADASGASGAAKKSKSSGTKSASAAGAVATTSALNRNQASKKAGKKNKKLSKRKAQAAARARSADARAAADTRATAAAPSPSGSKSESSTKSKPPNVESNQSDNSGGAGQTEENSDMASSSTENAAGSGPPCAACGRSVTGTYTKALGKNFHPHCFCCRMCHRAMGVGAGQFRERGGAPYCNPCYSTHLASRCARCTKPIMDTVTTAMDKTWHKECLTCTICRLPLTQTFWLYADKPNEPRCSRCVTGSEEAMPGVRYGSGQKAVNLPMFGHRNSPSGLPLQGAAAGAVGTTGGSGRVRLMPPVLPSVSRR